MLVGKPEELKAEQKAALEQMRQASSDVAAAYELAQDSAIMEREQATARWRAQSNGSSW